MEPVSVPPQRGTLADPEVLQNVPGHVIPILQREYDDFKTESTKFLAGDTPEDEFIKFRLKQGVYGQRQAAVQMIRVKLPFGGITPEQLDAFATVVEKYVPLNKGHITTRPNIQPHPGAPPALRPLAARHPRHRLPRPRARRRPGRRGPRRRRHLDHAARRPDPVRVRR